MPTIKEKSWGNFMKRRSAFILSGVGIAVAACFGGTYGFLKSARFGAIPDSTAAFKTCPHFYDGVFHNTLPTPVLTDNSSFIGAFAKSFLTEKIDPEPTRDLPTVKIDLETLNRQIDTVIWLGHSSFFIQLSGKRILIDPVLSDHAAPVSFSTRAFKGTNIYHPSEFPTVDLLIVSHDHWDHLDYPTINSLRHKIKEIVCPLGTDAHFLRWGFQPEHLHPLDWNQSYIVSENLTVTALEARHYSGRSLDQNKSFWASFLLQRPDYKIFFSGDSGFGPHFKEIGNRYGAVDLALLDSGQYNERWRYIHMNPDEALQAAKDLRAQNFIPAHIGKFCISMHPWYEPFDRLKIGALKNGVRLITPKIGQPLELTKQIPLQPVWWEENKNLSQKQQP